LPLSLITVAISLGVLALGFFGAYARHPCMLKAYGIIRILELTVHFLLLVAGVVIVFFFVGFLLSGGFQYTYDNDNVHPISVPMQPYYFGYDDLMGDGAPLNYPQPMKHTGTTTIPNETVNPTIGYVEQPVYVNNEQPIVDPIYVGYAYAGVYQYGSIINNYYNQLTPSQIIAVTMIGTAVVVIAFVLSLLYYALVLYTIVLSFRMSSQIKQSAAVYSAVEQKELQLTSENNQPFIYVVSDPTNGNQQVVLHPIDPTMFQMQSMA